MSTELRQKTRQAVVDAMDDIKVQLVMSPVTGDDLYQATTNVNDSIVVDVRLHVVVREVADGEQEA